MSQPKVKSDKLIIVDLETTCTNDRVEQFENEIIEIGLSILNLNTLLVEKNISIMVKPQRSKVTKFCTDLTGIRPEDVEDGLTLQEATDTLIKEYQTNEYIWASWGDFDRYMINRECKAYKCKVPFNRQHLNVKVIYAMHNRLSELIGLGAAVKAEGIPFIGKHHRGVDDARMTAELLLRIGGINNVCKT